MDSNLELYCATHSIKPELFRHPSKQLLARIRLHLWRAFHTSSVGWPESCGIQSEKEHENPDLNGGCCLCAGGDHPKTLFTGQFTVFVKASIGKSGLERKEMIWKPLILADRLLNRN